MGFVRIVCLRGGVSEGVLRLRRLRLRRRSLGVLLTMSDSKPQLPAASNDEAEIRALIERWAKAVREEDRAAFVRTMTRHLDVRCAARHFIAGLDAYMAKWEIVFLLG